MTNHKNRLRFALMSKGIFFGIAAAITMGAVGMAGETPHKSRVATTTGMKFMIVDSLDLQQVTFGGALRALETVIQQANPSDTVNFVPMLGETQVDALPKITLRLTNVPLEDALRYICEAAGLRYRVDKYAVVIFTPEREQQMRMITRTFKVVPGSFEHEVIKPANELSRGGTITRGTGPGQVIQLGQ